MTDTAELVKIAIVYYSTFGHIAILAAAIQEGAKLIPGVDVQLYQVAETLSEEVLIKRKAPPKLNHPIATPDTLANADGILFGIPSQFGMVPAQMKTLFDACGKLWYEHALQDKAAGFFFSSSSQGGGQESTAMGTMSFLTHHGMIFVPLGHRTPAQTDMSEVRGGNLWGCGTLSWSDKSRQVSALELEIARAQGESFARIAKKLARD